ncbi:unnamed protein product [Didymodactylos carnosus]|uniref:Uncharacterized protein n=1 Tax=Didymodactylos carnosus TaxID=1234261 RepID=A0A813VFN0_9BILA|nr:unnamed protein product [Didymodactylos carnosus]CAF1232219.1 unnamed protein product [Didymodactylos carnosus]CAF3628418.1 unnamed protein product [Didymodactylos carnosus]CAF4040365.1 unnamed protein product [Didymodactylos carnosus]
MSEQQKLSDTKIAEFDAIYKNRKQPMCKNCNTSEHVIPCIRGKPSRELSIYATMNKDHVALCGCTQPYIAWCKKCENYIEDPED